MGRGGVGLHSLKVERKTRVWNRMECLIFITDSFAMMMR